MTGLKEHHVLFLRVSKGGDGVWITNTGLSYGFSGNRKRLLDVLEGREEFALLEVIKKTQQEALPHG